MVTSVAVVLEVEMVVRSGGRFALGCVVAVVQQSSLYSSRSHSRPHSIVTFADAIDCNDVLAMPPI